MSRYLLLAAVLAAYVAVLLGNVLTRVPWVDEAYVANPAWNLAAHGFAGTTCVEMARTHWTRIDRHTYNTLPASILNLALWYRIFGFSLVVTRLPSMLWAALLLCSVFFLLRGLEVHGWVPAASVFLLAVDYNFMIAATFARPDMMCAALGFSALAAYAVLRSRRPRAAALAAGTLAALSLFTHPNGIVFIPALLVLEWFAFQMSIPLRIAALGVLPFAVCAACWLFYASQDFVAAMDQLRSNSYPGRFTGFRHPLTSIWEEVTGRFLTAYGLTLGEHPGGPVRARGLVMIAYLSAAGICLWLPRIRKNRIVKIVLTNLGLFTAYLTFFDATRFTYYMMLVTPLYATLLAIVLVHFWMQKQRWPAGAAAICLALLQVGGVVYRSVQNPYRNSLVPAVSFLRSRASASDLVFADPGFGFAYGFDRNAKEEITLGYRCGVDPSYIVVDANIRSNMNSWKTREPEIYAYMVRRLQSYTRVYDAPEYQIYQKRPAD